MFIFPPSSACDTAPAHKILCELDRFKTSYRFFKMAAITVANLFRVSGLVASHVFERKEISAYQIFTRYVNPQSTDDIYY